MNEGIPPARRRFAPPLGTVLVALAVAVAAYENGAYGAEPRELAAMVVWWIVIVFVGFGLWTVRLSRSSRAVVGLFAALTAWTLASALWSPSVEWTVSSFDRASLYFGVVLLVVLAGDRWLVPLVDGIAAATTAIAFVALASRFFPSLFSDRGLLTFLPDAESRLSFPLGYWNGLAIFVALGVPLLLGRAARPGARRPLVQGLALAPVPAIAAVVYLASSRGGVLAAAVGAAVLVGLATDRWLAFAAVVVGAAASVVEIVLLRAEPPIVDGPLGTAAAAAAGHRAALLTLVVTVATGAVWGAFVRVAPTWRPSRTAGRAALALGAVVVLGAIALSHPRRELQSFKQPPGAVSFTKGHFVASHLASGAGSGRWQFWSAAVDQWKHAPVVGEGAGTFAAWWAQHGPITYFITDAHSLYLQTFGELGVVGGLLLIALVAVGLVGGARRALRAGPDRDPAAAACAAFAAWAVGAGIDWIWQLPAVTIAGVALLGAAHAPPGARVATRSFARGASVLLTAWLLLVAQLVPFVARIKIDESEAAVRRGELRRASSEASTARLVEPWAAAPYLQLALVAEEQNRLPDARRWIAKAIDRSPRDWRLWLVSARLATKAGAIPDARAALHEAKRLNPRSPLFS